MPELPEIESLTRDLRRLIPGKTIVAAHCGQPRAIKPAVEQFKELAKGPVVAVRRRAKSFIFQLDHGSIWFHMGLRGQVTYEAQPQPAAAAAVALDFADGSRLSIVRSFMGHAHFLTPEESDEQWQEFGWEPLDEAFTDEVFRTILAGSPRAAVKALLMDQSAIAGIGNYYGDEILHAARIHPSVRAAALAEDQQRRLLDAVRSVLAKAVEQRGEPEWISLDGRGGSFVAQIHGRDTCGRCGSASQKTSLQSRTTYFCPSCQPAR